MQVSMTGLGLGIIGFGLVVNGFGGTSVSSGQSVVMTESPSLKDRAQTRGEFVSGESTRGGDARQRSLGLPACDIQSGLFEGPFPVQPTCSSPDWSGTDPGFSGGGNIGVTAGRPLRFESGYVSRYCDGNSSETDLLFGFREQSLVGDTLEYGWFYASVSVDSIAEELVSNTDWNAYQVQVIPYGWEDIDGDGLEDLVVRANASERVEDPDFGGCSEWGGESVSREYWFRNLDFIVPDNGRAGSGLRGDLNGDCEVSGADLGLLLVEYGNVCE